ncbi:unnamed protein product, partial [Prorocentrum cordatum]
MPQTGAPQRSLHSMPVLITRTVWHRGNNDKLQRQLDALQKKYDKLASSTTSTAAPAGVAGDEPKEDAKEKQLRDSIKDFETAIKAVGKLSDGGGAAKASLETQLREARKALSECKPALTQHTNTGHKLARMVAKRKQLGGQHAAAETPRSEVSRGATPRGSPTSRVATPWAGAGPRRSCPGALQAAGCAAAARAEHLKVALRGLGAAQASAPGDDVPPQPLAPRGPRSYEAPAQQFPSRARAAGDRARRVSAAAHREWPRRRRGRAGSAPPHGPRRRSSVAGPRLPAAAHQGGPEAREHRRRLRGGRAPAAQAEAAPDGARRRNAAPSGRQQGA